MSLLFRSVPLLSVPTDEVIFGNRNQIVFCL